MTNQETLKLALEALDMMIVPRGFQAQVRIKKIYETIEAEIAKQEQGEPVGEILLTNGDYKEVSWKNGKLPPVGAKLYTATQPLNPLTDEHLLVLLAKVDEHAVRLPKGLRDFARAIEAAHGIKENT